MFHMLSLYSNCYWCRGLISNVLVLDLYLHQHEWQPHLRDGVTCHGSWPFLVVDD